MIFIHLILAEYGSQQLYTQDFSTLVDISATHTPADSLLYRSVVKTNDITASYIEQVEVFKNTLKEAQGSNPRAVLENDIRLIVPTGGLKSGLSLYSSGVFEHVHTARHGAMNLCS